MRAPVAAGPAILQTMALDDVLRERAIALAQPPKEEPDSDLVKLLQFRLGDEWFALPVGAVREIQKDYSVTRIPGTPGHVVGVINVRGEIMSVTDLAVRIGMPARPSAHIPQGLPAVVLACGELTTAGFVDEVGDIAEVSAGAIEPVVFPIDNARSDHVSGTVYREGVLVSILDPERLIEPIDIGM